MGARLKAPAQRGLAGRGQPKGRGGICAAGNRSATPGFCLGVGQAKQWQQEVRSGWQDHLLPVQDPLWLLGKESWHHCTRDVPQSRGAKGQGEGCHQANGRAQGSCRMEPGANPPQLAAQTPLIKGEGRLALLVAATHAGRAVVGWPGASPLLQPLQAGGPHPLLPRPAPSPHRLHGSAVACVCSGEVQLCL